MLTTNKKTTVYRHDGTEKPYIEGACLSSDTKPTGVANGSTLMEMDTGKVFMFDEAGNQWRVFA